MSARAYCSSTMMTIDQETPNADVSRTAVLTSSTRIPLKKNFVRIVSQNALGIKSEERIEELTAIMKEREIFATCLQETWRTGSEVLDINSHKLI